MSTVSTARNMREVLDELWDLEDKESDSPDRILTDDSLLPTEEERNDYRDSFKEASLDSRDSFSSKVTAELLPKI